MGKLHISIMNIHAWVPQSYTITAANCPKEGGFHWHKWKLYGGPELGCGVATVPAWIEVHVAAIHIWQTRP